MFGQLHPCPLCGDSAPCRRLKGRTHYRRIACPRCGSFLIEPTLPPRPWTRLAAEEALLAAFLPLYIRYQNRRHRVPLLTLENWRALARRGRAVRVAQLRDAPARGAR
jgi:hypothetical protein